MIKRPLLKGSWVTVIVMVTAVRDISNAVTMIVWLVVQSLNKKLTTKTLKFGRGSLS